MTDLERIVWNHFDQIKESDSHQGRASQVEVQNTYAGLRNIIFRYLLSHQIRLSDIPQENRINCVETSGYFSVAAHRYASASGDITYLMEVLSIMYEDAIYGVSNGFINRGEFYDLLRQWLNYFDYDRIEFRGDEEFERYFQEQKERHRDFFTAFGL